MGEPNKINIPFNRPFLTGKETQYIFDAVKSGKISGNGIFTEKCHHFFQEKYGFNKCLLTTSCTDALEMAALLLNIQPGDEVIVPSYTFVSTALAFVRQGAKIVFCDSRQDHPGMNEDLLESLITPKTKAIVPMHYAGVACDMDKIMSIANNHQLFVVEDAAQAIDAYYKNRPLGSIGHLGCFSFHETKNIISGEGGMLVINDEQLFKRAEILWEKGTDRAQFFRGEINKYGWVDIGSSFLPSEIISAFLYAQLEKLDIIQEKRMEIWRAYMNGLSCLSDTSGIKLPAIPDYASNNGHMFYLVCPSGEARSALINRLKDNGIMTVFHYQGLHQSKYYSGIHGDRPLPYAEKYTDCLVRLPLYYEIDFRDVKLISQAVLSSIELI